MVSTVGDELTCSSEALQRISLAASAMRPSPGLPSLSERPTAELDNALMSDERIFVEAGSVAHSAPDQRRLC
jgi:hypothetical protein